MAHVAATPIRRTELQELGHLALPMILGQWTQMAMHAIDTAMVGRLGVEAVAASSLGNLTTGSFFPLVAAVGAALPPLAAQALAAGDRPRADRLLRHAWACSLGLSLLAVGLFSFGLRWLPLSGQPEAVLAQARPYGQVLIWSLLPAMLLQNLRGFAEAHGHPWLPLGNIILGLAINVGCNVVLIYGLGPVPAQGVPGAAMGTGIARVVMLGHFLWVLQQRPELRPAPGWLTRESWSPATFRALLSLGGLTAVATLLVIGSGLILAFWASRLGPAALAAHEIARQVWLLGYVIPFGWSMAVALRAAHWLGRADPAGLRRCVGVALRAGGAIGLSLALLVLLLRGWLPRLFLGDDPAVSAVAAQTGVLLCFLAVVLVGEGVFLTSAGVCRGLGRMGPAAAAYLGTYWVLGLSAAYWLGRGAGLGVTGLWIGYSGAVVVGTVAITWFCHRIMRRAIAG